MNKQTCSTRNFFSVPVPIELPQIVFPTRRDRTIFIRAELLGLRRLSNILTHFCRGRRIQKSVHSDLESFDAAEASSNLIWV